MGHNTYYRGEVRFKDPGKITVDHLRRLRMLLDLTPGDKSEVGAAPPEYPALELTTDLGGLKWDGSEKTYGMDKVLNWLTAEMREAYPEFTLSGGLTWTDESREQGVVEIDENGNAQELVVDPLDLLRQAEGAARYAEAWKVLSAAYDQSDGDWHDLHQLYQRLAKALK